MFKFNKNYEDLSQVQSFYSEFRDIKESLDSFAYNSCFKGKIKGIRGEDEDTAIYLLQQLDTELELTSKLNKFKADGYRVIKPEAGGFKKFNSVVRLGNDRSRADHNEYPEARVFFADDKFMYIVPKRNRTKGYRVAPDSILLAK